MERLEIVPSELRAAAQVFADAASSIEQELNRLDAELDHLRLAWQGEAQAAFDHAQTRARFDLTELQQQLAVIATEAEAIAEQYGVIDREAAAGLGGQ